MNKDKESFNHDQEYENENDVLILDEEDIDIISILEQIGIMQQDLETEIKNMIDSETDPNKPQSPIILAIKNYLKKKLKFGLRVEKSKELEKKIPQDISRSVETVSKRKNSKTNEINKNDKGDFLSAESRKNLKRILKEFVDYENHKIINPKRIAGETKDDNYRHNLKHRGERVAEKYAETKYSPSKIEKLKSEAGISNKITAGIGRKTTGFSR